GGATVGIDAAHVRWFAFDGPDELDNGLALCSLHHKLFDFGVLGLDDGHRIRVSSAFTARTPARRPLYHLHAPQLQPRPAPPPPPPRRRTAAPTGNAPPRSTARGGARHRGLQGRPSRGLGPSRSKGHTASRKLRSTCWPPVSAATGTRSSTPCIPLPMRPSV